MTDADYLLSKQYKVTGRLVGDEELNDYDEFVAYPPLPACILNVAGSRESHAPGIQEAVFPIYSGSID